MTKIVDDDHFSATELINESKELIRRRSSSLSLDDAITTSPPAPPTKKVTADTITTSDSILGTKHLCDALPVIKDYKPRKSVHFNMDKNETCEIEQPELNNSFDSIASDDIDHLDVSSDEDDYTDESDDDEEYKDAHSDLAPQNNLKTNESQIISSISNLESEKSKLLKELEFLHKRHNDEMKQLREEYQRRREDYYNELDQVQIEMDEKKNMSIFELSNAQDIIKLKERQENYLQEKKDMEEKEADLKKRKQQVEEQEKELKEYQTYLDRRHKTLNKKEEDLCILQDELEEFSDVIKDKEKELKNKQNSLDILEKTCKHDEKEIERTRLELLESFRTESDLRRKLKINEDEVIKKQNLIAHAEEENKKLQMKIKHLESQIQITIKQKTSLKNTSSDGSTTELISPHGSKLSLQQQGLLSPRFKPPLKVKKTKDGSTYTEGNTCDLYMFNPIRNFYDSSEFDTVDTGRGGESYRHMNLYANDTTPHKVSENSVLSRTCLIM